MTVKETLNKGIIALKSNNIDSPKLKARLLLQHTLKKTREYLIIYDQEEITKEQEIKYIRNLERLIKGEPLQHITHSQEFMKMNFYINKNVLIPRPDTETLVEEVINISKQFENPCILDLCTGSGAIAISLAKNIKNAKIYASDISQKALEVAKKNAKKHKQEEKITFIESDLFEKIPQMKFDIIVSNPPYIKKEEIKNLDREVQKEPQIALDGGYDGLKFYREIAKQSYEYLKYGSYLCLEIGYDQKIDVIEILENEQKYSKTYCIKDLYGNDRVIITKIEE